MVFVERKTSLAIPIYEPPTSIPYDGRVALERILFLADFAEAFRDASLELYEKSVKDSGYILEPKDIGAMDWDNASALIRRVIETEEERITDPKSWSELKKILLAAT